MLPLQLLYNNIRNSGYKQSPYHRLLNHRLLNHRPHNSYHNSNINMAKKRKSSSSSTAAAAATANTNTNTNSNANANVKLLMILSPAKTLCLDPGKTTDRNSHLIKWTKPLEELTSERCKVIAAMKDHSSNKEKLGKLLKTSRKITETAFEYWKEIPNDAVTVTKSPSPCTSKPCIFMFNGAAYSGLDINNLVFGEDNNNNNNNNVSDEGFDILNYLQQHLRIVDPLYGWLRPMDEMFPYRLEMATKNVFSGDNAKLKLAEYWKESIQSCIQNREQIDDDGSHHHRPIVIVNLASDEYSATVDSDNGKLIIIKIVFKHGGRVIAVHAKRARGLMVRYMASNKIENIEHLMDFDLEGYTFQSKESSYSQEEYIRCLLELESKSKSKSNDDDDNDIPAKGGKKKKKKVESMTLVFERPGDWKK
jgi:cytoplasmic iron level regulating protein YaaA (DUF328/UPF0246 family)